MRRSAIAGLAVLLMSGLGLGACGALVSAAVGGSATPVPSPAATLASTVTSTGTATSPGTALPYRPAVPAQWEAVDRSAAATCHGLEWSVLAAIGRVESDSGRSTLPGVASGANAYGAEVIYGWDGGLWHLRDETTGGRGSLVSEGSLSRGQGGGHSGFIRSPAHDDQISSVASGVSI